jgi:hypothetical protein
VSGLVGVIFVYKSSLYLMAMLSKCAVEKQRDVIRFYGQNTVKHMKFTGEC